MSKHGLALLSSILLTSLALGAQSLSFEATAESIQIDQAQSTTHLKGHAKATIPSGAPLKMSATRFAVESTSGVATLEGDARIEFDGGEIQAELLVVTTRADGVRDVTSESMRIVRAASL